MRTQYRVTGEGSDGGLLIWKGRSLERLVREMTESGYTVVRVEKRRIQPWQEIEIPTVPEVQ